jgi:hypothetical protein
MRYRDANNYCPNEIEEFGMINEVCHAYRFMCCSSTSQSIIK